MLSDPTQKCVSCPHRADLPDARMQINKWHSAMTVLTGVIFHAGPKGRSILILQGSEQYFNCRTLHLTPSFKYQGFFYSNSNQIYKSTLAALLRARPSLSLIKYWTRAKGRDSKASKKFRYHQKLALFLGQNKQRSTCGSPLSEAFNQ